MVRHYLSFRRSFHSLSFQDDPALHDYNVPERVQEFIQAALDEALGFAINHIIMTMGSDFQYQNGNEWFKNMDKLIKYVNDQVHFRMTPTWISI